MMNDFVGYTSDFYDMLDCVPYIIVPTLHNEYYLQYEYTATSSCQGLQGSLASFSF
jgi:hypothetical protein